MRYSKAELGRVIVLRLEDGDVVHECVERVAAEEGISRAMVIALGGARAGSTLVVGPEDGEVLPPTPLKASLQDVHEVAGVGTLFPDESGRPSLHMHMACGREERALVGCIRAGVETWQVLEVVMIELKGSEAARLPDPDMGFSLLVP